MSVVRRVARVVPIGIPVAGGRKYNTLFAILDGLFRSTAEGDAIETKWGRLTLDSGHPHERILSYAFENVMRYYETSELGRYIARFAAAGSTFLDIGANLGIYALVGRLHGLNTIVVEPEPSHSAFLRRNEVIYGRVLAVALSDRSASLPLYYNAANPGATSLLPSPGYIKGSDLVPVRTFTDLAASGELGEVGAIWLVKIDVEGLEAEVVSGMRGILKTGWRPQIWCEVRGDRSGRNGGSYRVVRDILTEFGYFGRELKNGRERLIDEAQVAERGVFDVLFRARS
jgi:FkbM family methyltransferase